jgi:PhzF family phenazine biosynthesis protein
VAREAEREKKVTGVPIWQVDAFTDRPFAGNPAAVCLLNHEPNESWMQSVAAEMNLSETAFVRRIEEGFQLRWFTPKIEVSLCGHATLASAFVVWSAGLISTNEPIRFHTKSGVLTASRNGELIELNFPVTRFETCDPPAALLQALGVESPTFVGRTTFGSYLVVTTPDVVRALRPNFRKLIEIQGDGAIVTAESDDTRFDFISRYFAPRAGIDEDPVTGSAHCCLCPYWSQRLGKTVMTGYQASTRGGVVHVRLHGDRVILGGHAVLVLTGELV